MPSLSVWVDNIHAATLSESQNQFSLGYTENWTKNNGFAFSPHLPLDTISSGASVRNFFSNLLPEGQVLEGLTSALQISKYDVFGILSKIGQDCAGALVLLEERNTPESISFNLSTDYTILDEDVLNRRILESNAANTPILFWENIPRMSLPGVQNKLGVYMDDLDRLYLPKSAAPTSHILKPDSVAFTKHRAIAANEYFCMQLAKSIGLDVPDVSYRPIPTPIYLVKRYDRIWTSPNQLIRSHQIDGCQALDLPPSQKYEQEHSHSIKGATLKDIMGLADLCVVPVIAKQRLLQWLIFNYLIGNSDAHAKNIAFLINPYFYLDFKLSTVTGMQVAPLYDLVCGAVYGYEDMAQSIGDETNFALIRHADWKQFCQECQFPFSLLQKIAKELLRKLHSNISNVTIKSLEITKQPIIQEIAQLTLMHAEYLNDSLKI